MLTYGKFGTPLWIVQHLHSALVSVDQVLISLHVPFSLLWVPHLFIYKTMGFLFQNKSKIPGPSCKIFGIVLEGENLGLITKEIQYPVIMKILITLLRKLHHMHKMSLKFCIFYDKLELYKFICTLQGIN